jgi:hypothetical protein
MLGRSARHAGLFVASSLGAGAAFLCCGLQSQGLGSSSGGSASLGGGGYGGYGVSTSAVGGAGSVDAGNDAAPIDAKPLAYVSCMAWLTASPGSASGVYDLIDGTGAIYQAYCDMESGDGTDGGVAGGWTLALKIDGTNSAALDYDDPLWTNEMALAADDPDLDTSEAKLPSFWNVPMTELRVGMIEDGVTRWLAVPVAIAGGPVTLLYLIQSGTPQTMLGRGAWEGLLAVGSLQTNCAWEGINADSLVRIGIVADDSGDCQSPDSFIGFGAVDAAAGRFTAPSPPSGNIAEWSPDHGDQTITTFGYVMVR